MFIAYMNLSEDWFLFSENQRGPSYAFWPGAIIKPHWLELPLSRHNFYGPKDVRAIEVRLYIQGVLDILCRIIRSLKTL